MMPGVRGTMSTWCSRLCLRARERALHALSALPGHRRRCVIGRGPDERPGINAAHSAAAAAQGANGSSRVPASLGKVGSGEGDSA